MRSSYFYTCDTVALHCKEKRRPHKEGEGCEEPLEPEQTCELRGTAARRIKAHGGSLEDVLTNGREPKGSCQLSQQPQSPLQRDGGASAGC
ncbi:unnamed protein product [Lota lota]